MVNAEDAICIYKILWNNNIRAWLSGGWGIDALLGKQSRTHKDLDLIIQLDDIHRMRELFEHEGFMLKELWEENLWAIDTKGNEIATAFVLKDTDGREIDVHALQFNEQGDGLPMWNEREGFYFSAQDLSGKGSIASCPVQCLSPEMQVLCHTGYQLPEKQILDLHLLQTNYSLKFTDGSLSTGDP